MSRSANYVRLIRFSVFEVDRNAGELFKQGRKVKLQGQPFELLVTLLERAGEVLTRAELRQKIWPSDAVGDFEHGLNRAVNKVREALGDSAETPRFIETLPRRGYRFIGSIEKASDSGVGLGPGERHDDSGDARPEGFWIAVLPFKCGAVASLVALAEGITDDIVTGLARFSYLRVISRSLGAGYTSEAVDACTAGKKLGVRYVIHGSVRQAGSTCRIAAQLVGTTSS